MLIKHFREVQYRTRDPLRPGQWARERRLEDAGTISLRHNDRDHTADDQGWFDVPEDVGRFFLSRPGWRTPAQVDEAVAAGEINENDSPASRPRPKAAPKKRTAG